MISKKVNLLDCTLRDGGYYNNWDFDSELVRDYLQAMEAIEVDYVELGLRSFAKDGFKGGFAYTSDEFIDSLNVPKGLKISVMVNASELIAHEGGVIQALKALFKTKNQSPVDLIRIACHIHEFEPILLGVELLKDYGYLVGLNLMQISDRSDDDIKRIAMAANSAPIDALYFADSLGSMDPLKSQKQSVLLGVIGVVILVFIHTIIWGRLLQIQ